MAGIYIHIPFCRKACHYCNFHFSTSLQSLEKMVEALQVEARLRKSYINQPVETIYFGGGTPSLLSVNHLKSIISTIYTNYNVSSTTEITLEANPDDIDALTLRSWKEAGINRLSIGIQSFFDDELQWMNRNHTAQQSLKCIKQAQDNGFENISIDLIYGTPSLTEQQWIQILQTATSLNIPHLSCYALTVEEKTALSEMIKKKKSSPVNTDSQAEQFLKLIDFLTMKGYEHYEISNFSKPEWRSKHNTSYWLGKTYLGIGPSAHSFNKTSRQWNIANNALYIKAIQQKEIPYTIEQLTLTQQLNEYIMISLRTMEGLDLNYVVNNWGKEYAIILKEHIPLLQQNGWIEKNLSNKIILSLQGKLKADGIAAMLFFDEEKQKL